MSKNNFFQNVYLVQDLFNIGRGRVINQNEIREKAGVYPVFSSQSFNNGEMGRISTYDFEGEYVTWTTDGAYAGTVFYRDGKFNCTNVCGTLKPKEGIRVNLKYAAYYLGSVAKKHVSYVGNPKLMNNTVGEIEFPLPKLEEQNKISEIIMSVDRVIQLTNEEIKKLKNLKKGIVQDLLTKGIGHTKFKQSLIGKVPQSWDVLTFDEITDFIRCGVASTPEYVDKDGVPFLSAQNVQGDKVKLEKFSLITKELHKKLIKNAKPQRNDILYSRVGAGFGQAALVEFDWEFSVYVSLSLIRMKNTHNPKFFVHQLNSTRVKTLAANTVFQGGGVPNLNVEVTKNFLMVVPPINEQNKICNIIDRVSKSIDAKLEKLDSLNRIKSGLMNDLLSGKVRIKL